MILACYTAFVGALAGYTQSGYYPKNLFHLRFKGVKIIVSILLLLSIALFINESGWAKGGTIFFFLLGLILTLLQLTAVSGKKYFWSFIVLTHLVVAGSLIYHFMN